MTVPQEFKDYMYHLLGELRSGRLEKALDEEPSVSVRINPFKIKTPFDEWRNVPEFDGNVPWASDAFYLRQRPPFTFDPLLHAGCYYVQEAASMFLEQAVRQYVHRPVKALDLCAAPGGKSTLLRACLPEGSFLVCNEPVKSRAKVLVENMVKWGHPGVMVTNNYPEAFSGLQAYFDLIVTDVPCSGEGMFRKEEEAISGWNMQSVLMCRDRQRDIIRDVWPSLKPGGLLVYSTCTFNQYEDEENVAWIVRELGAEVLPVNAECSWGVLSNFLPENEQGGGIPVSHLLPGFSRGEGFFLSVLRKDEDVEPAESYMVKRQARQKSVRSGNPHLKVPAECMEWIADAGIKYELKNEEGRIMALPAAFSSWCQPLHDQLNVLSTGVTVAEQKGRDWLPSHGLAMSTCLNRDAFPILALTYKEAVSFLRKESFVLPSSQPKGFVLLEYENHPLGFVKNIGMRANNLYPSEWRIRSTYDNEYSLTASGNVHNVK